METSADAQLSRRILVSQRWFTELEDYLADDERFTNTRTGWPLILFTPNGKRLEFYAEEL